MDWAEFVVRYVVPPAVLGLVITVMKLWKANNPVRQEKHFEAVHQHAQLLIGHEGKILGLEDRERERRGQGERIGRLEVEVGHIREDTGEMKKDLKELLRRSAK